VDTKRAGISVRHSALVLAAAGLAAAVAAPLDVSRAPGSAAEPLKGEKPLKGELRLSLGKLRAIGAMPITADGLNQKFTEFSRKASGYEFGVKARSTIAKECASKAYTVQDQKAAGCTGGDTMDQCTDKLYRQCLRTSGNPGRDVSIQEFQESATKAAAEARALSRMLNQYADQADQNAKTLVP